MPADLSIINPNWLNKEAGAKAYTNLPVRTQRYKTFYISASAMKNGVACTDINQIFNDKVFLEINGKPNRELTVDEIRHLSGMNGELFDTLNKFDKLTLPIHMAQDWNWTVDTAEAVALGTGDLINLSLSANVASGLTNVEITSQYDSDTPVIPKGLPNEGAPLPSGMIIRTMRDRKECTGATTLIIRDIALIGFAKRMHFHSSKIARIRVVDNRQTIWEQTKKFNNLWLTKNGMIPDPNWFVVAFDATQKVADGLVAPTLKDFEIHVTMEGADIFDIITEFLAPIA